MGGLLLFVAGPGLEPGSGGYEPPEVPLLYPAREATKKVYTKFRSCLSYKLNGYYEYVQDLGR